MVSKRLSIYLLSRQYQRSFQVWKMIIRSAGCNIFSVITSRLESSVVIRAPRSLGNDAFDIYSCSTSVPDALVVCSLFYWAWWVSLSLLLSSMADSVTTAIYILQTAPASTIDQTVDMTWRRHKRLHSHRFLNVSLGTQTMISDSDWAGRRSVTMLCTHRGCFITWGCDFLHTWQSV